MNEKLLLILLLVWTGTSSARILQDIVKYIRHEVIGDRRWTDEDWRRYQISISKPIRNQEYMLWEAVVRANIERNYPRKSGSKSEDVKFLEMEDILKKAREQVKELRFTPISFEPFE